MTDTKTPAVEEREWIARFVAVLKTLGWPGMTAIIEAKASWDDEWQREEGPEEAARTMLSYLAEDGQ